MEDFSLIPMAPQEDETEKELLACNEISKKSCLSLTEKDMAQLMDARFKALERTGRVEFGGGVLKELVQAFHSSKYVTAENYRELLEELQDAFYYFRGECDRLVSDRELIAFMRKAFDGEAHGEIDYLVGTSLERFCMKLRGKRGEYLD